jgi:hypothetical protein
MKFRAIAVSLCVASCSAVSLSPAFETTVVDRDTGQPIQGAYVVYTWKTDVPIHGSRFCDFLSISQTDSNGIATIRNWGSSKYGNYGDGKLSRVYFPGYALKDYSKRELGLTKDMSGDTYRLRQVGMGLNCPEEGTISLLAQMYRLVAEEAASMGTNETKDLADVYMTLASQAEMRVKNDSQLKY